MSVCTQPLSQYKGYCISFIFTVFPFLSSSPRTWNYESGLWFGRHILLLNIDIICHYRASRMCNTRATPRGDGNDCGRWLQPQHPFCSNLLIISQLDQWRCSCNWALSSCWCVGAFKNRKAHENMHEVLSALFRRFVWKNEQEAVSKISQQWTDFFETFKNVLIIVHLQLINCWSPAMQDDHNCLRNTKSDPDAELHFGAVVAKPHLKQILRRQHVFT